MSIFRVFQKRKENKMLEKILKRKFTAIILVYSIYISLGIPDSLLGVAWPTIQLDLGTPIYYGSIIMAIVAIIASISSVSYIFISKNLTPFKC
jgi:hypothetical protein